MAPKIRRRGNFTFKRIARAQFAQAARLIPSRQLTLAAAERAQKRVAPRNSVPRSRVPGLTILMNWPVSTPSYPSGHFSSTISLIKSCARDPLGRATVQPALAVGPRSRWRPSAKCMTPLACRALASPRSGTPPAIGRKPRSTTRWVRTKARVDHHAIAKEPRAFIAYGDVRDQLNGGVRVQRRHQPMKGLVDRILRRPWAALPYSAPRSPPVTSVTTLPVGGGCAVLSSARRARASVCSAIYRE